MIKVVCWKWNNGVHPKKGLQFTHEHVNRLRNMVARHLHVPHEFICITDDPTGIDPDIRIMPLWKDHREMGGCYTRLRAFSEQVGEWIGGKFVWLDLDTIILDDITSLLTGPEDFKMWGDTHPLTPYNGSMVMMEPGARKQVWEQFDPQKSPQAARKLGYVGTDQAWIGACLGKGEARWTVADGVYSFRCHIRPTGNLPQNAKIVFFHGSTDPSQLALQKQFPWVKENWR